MIGVDPNDAKREAKRQQLAERQCTTLATLIIEDGPYETSLTGRQVVNWKPAMSALRRGLKDHFDLAISELTRRQIMAAVDRIAKTGKRGAAKDLRKNLTTGNMGRPSEVGTAREFGRRARPSRGATYAGTSRRGRRRRKASPPSRLAGST